MKQIIHFGANQVFDNAITYTCIAMFDSRPSASFDFKRLELGLSLEAALTDKQGYSGLAYEDIRTASELYGNNQWIFFNSPEGFNVFKKIYKQKSCVQREIEAFVGIQTSRDPLYISEVVECIDGDYIRILVNSDRDTLQPPIITAEFEVEAELFRPVVVGRDTQRYKTLRTSKVLFIPYRVDGSLITLSEIEEHFPKSYKFITAYKEVFCARENGNAKKLQQWHAYIYPKNINKFGDKMLTGMDICSKHPNLAINEDGMLHTDTAYSFKPTTVASKSLKTYAGLLNSKVFWWFLKHTGDTLQGDARRMKTNYINPFPLPDMVSEHDETLITALVDKLVLERAGQARPDVIDGLEASIDKAVYDLYMLNDAEIALIEQSI